MVPPVYWLGGEPLSESLGEPLGDLLGALIPQEGVDLSPEDQEKAAHITLEGLYEPTCMPQGLCNAPAMFKRAMDSILQDLKLSCVLLYLYQPYDHLKAVFIKNLRGRLEAQNL
ncbi:hypothetical protein DSO57_1015640 [Entomophthora muscae]|uniref:Uncharacterized protein n=1 Tax=Entomophthora muscae TaxID=34485 RepID=A0ACC2STS4_9FUNG|nr:hypothetical protein DSO57_1015640 [Entomophthora muscae]